AAQIVAIDRLRVQLVPETGIDRQAVGYFPIGLGVAAKVSRDLASFLNHRLRLDAGWVSQEKIGEWKPRPGSVGTGRKNRAEIVGAKVRISTQRIETRSAHN